MKDVIEIKIIKKIDINQIINLYKEVGWWDSEDEKNPQKVKKILKGSFLFVGAFYNKKLVGMARIISDKASDAYIQDVIVLKDFRNRKVGKKLILFVLDFLKNKGIKWIGLISTPEFSEFYKNLGFKVLKDYTPMIYDK